MRFALAFSLSLSLAPRGDAWFASDKVKHFFVSAFIESVSYSALRTADARHADALAGATVFTGAVGIGKELVDEHRGKGFSVRDLAWDGAGMGSAALLLSRTRR
ncbi:MAG TPA: hypothetical protein VFK13_11065 [Gemmatimonadaceae bacterium]|nr:hypothetical protein [Gemmatimonadaceae bacterium]